MASKGGGKAEAVNKAFLLKAAAEVPGLHPTGTPSDQELASLEEQTTTTTDSTYGPLVKAFAAFDMDASSSLTLPRCKQIIALFDGVAGAELESALAEAKVSAAEAKTDGEAFDKRKPKINYHTLVEAFLAGAAKKKGDKDKEKKKEAKGGGGGWFAGWFGGGGGEEKEEKKEKPVKRTRTAPKSKAATAALDEAFKSEKRRLEADKEAKEEEPGTTQVL